ncbi:MAG: sigma-70 family RNA polymerase sigma factor [Planctomycetes bacterium]|nr:sigma-70 family RNA polymerase sigma factor [Planctomycetota bacterium]
MARYQAGDTEAFQELYRRYAPRLQGLMRRSLFRQEEAADLVQQTFLHLHRARNDFRTGALLRPWLFTIALNLKRKHFRTVARRPASELGEIDPAGNDPGPGSPLERSEEQAAVREALAKLPAGTREVIELHWFEGLPFAEVAQTVGASLSAVKVRAHRGYKALRELLADRNQAGGAE